MIFSRESGSTASNRLTASTAIRWPRFRHRAWLLVAAACAATLGVAFGGPASAHSAAEAGVSPSATLSGLAWPSGVWINNDNPTTAAAFASWRGRPLDVVNDFPTRATWPDIDDPAWLYQRWKGSPYRLSFAVAMLPQSVPGVSMQSCANGAYNSYWKTFGSVIASYGLGSSIIRLGWEFNGNWYVWQASQPATWAACWRQIVTSARSTAPNLQWDWNVNRGVSSALANPTLAYPGDSYVTMVGVDSYDWYPAATTAAGWQTQLNGTQGLNYWLNFAESHGKQLSVPEWGNVASGTSAGGDNPAYVNDMHAFFAANAAHIAYEANFQGPSTSTGGSYLGATLVPKSAAAYRAAF